MRQFGISDHYIPVWFRQGTNRKEHTPPMPQSSERLLISSAVRNNDFSVVLGSHITSDMFQSHGDQFDFLFDYFRKYRKMPSKPAFRSKFPEFRMVSVNDTGHFCLAPETKVLTGDLQWVTIGSTAVGDRLIGFEEDMPRRRWQNTTILKKRRIKRPCYKLTFSDGTEVTASSDHKWLGTKYVKADGSAYGKSFWYTTEEMVEGVHAVLKPLDVWKTETSRDAGYLAAAFDGEGHLTARTAERVWGPAFDVKLSYAQNDNAMLDHVEQTLKSFGFEYAKHHRDSGCNILNLSRRREMMRFLGSIRPERLLPKFDVESFGCMSYDAERVQLVKKEFVGEQTVIALETDTHTFIAEGLASHNCSEVRREHTRRLMLQSLDHVTNLIADGEVEEAARTLHSQVVTISAQVGAVGDVDVIHNFDEIYQEAEAKAKAVEDGGFAGIPMGFDTFDARTGGAQGGELIIVGARANEGKSWVGQRWAASALCLGHTVQFNTLEMSRSQVAFRIHSLLSGALGENIFSNIDLQQGRNFDPKKYRAFLRTLKQRLAGGLYVTDGSRGKVSATTIASQIERNNPAIVFIDYITLMDGGQGGDWKKIAQLTGELKSVAQQYNVPIVALAQLNRANGIGSADSPAGLESLAQSDSIGQDADQVYTWKQLSPSVLMGRMAKNRHGFRDIKTHVDFRPAEGVFEEVCYEDAMKLKDKDDERKDREAHEKKKSKLKLVMPVAGGDIKDRAHDIEAAKQRKRNTRTLPVPAKKRANPPARKSASARDMAAAAYASL